VEGRFVQRYTISANSWGIGRQDALVTVGDRCGASTVHNEERAVMRAEMIEVVETELKRFAADLNLSDTQKTQLKAALEQAHDKIDEIHQKNPNVTRADIVAKLKEARGAIRERVVKFLTPEQLTKWDQEVTKAKSFLGQKLDA
jgi:predicted HTH transcriptional regulator